MLWSSALIHFALSDCLICQPQHLMLKRSPDCWNNTATLRSGGCQRQLIQKKVQPRNNRLKIISLSLVIPISIAALVGWVIYRELSIRPHWQTLYRTQGVVDSPERQQALLQLNRLRASMRKAPLQGASLDKIKLEGANLWDANLSFAHLRSARLEGANLEGANLSDANLYDAHLSDANLNSANLRKANLNRADLSFANLNRADLIRAHLHSAQLSDADLIFADLRKADLHSAQLSDADLIFANLRKADLHSADLRSANLNRANLIKAKKLTPSQIKSACNWEKAIYKEANQQYIDRLFIDKASDPSEPVDCSQWK